MLEIGFAVGKIGGLVVFGERNVVGFANITGLEGGDGIFSREFFEGRVVGTFWIEGLELFLEGVGFEAERGGCAIAGEENEEEWADNRKADDDEGPK